MAAKDRMVGTCCGCSITVHQCVLAALRATRQTAMDEGQTIARRQVPQTTSAMMQRGANYCFLIVLLFFFFFLFIQCAFEKKFHLAQQKACEM